MTREYERTDAVAALRASIREKNFGRLYILHGEEIFLMQYYLEQLRKAIVDPVTESFNYHKLTPENFSVQAFSDALENLPIMAERTFVWVDEIDLFKLSESDRGFAAQLLSDIGQYCTVVFTYETTPWKPDKRMKTLWQAIEENAMIVELPKQKQSDLIAWITRHFSANGKKITPALCAYLIDITGGTMTELSGEIAKISAYSAADTVCKEDIDAVTEPVIDAVVFQMTDMISDGNFGGALKKLRELLKMQQEPIMILGAIGSHFRRLSVAKTLQDNGKTASELMRLCGLTDYAAKKTMSAARRFSAELYRKAAEWILETDRMMKTSYDDPARLLEMLIMQIAQEAKNG